jgi:hypothetical protein
MTGIAVISCYSLRKGERCDRLCCSDPGPTIGPVPLSSESPGHCVMSSVSHIPPTASPLRSACGCPLPSTNAPLSSSIVSKGVLRSYRVDTAEDYTLSGKGSVQLCCATGLDLGLIRTRHVVFLRVYRSDTFIYASNYKCVRHMPQEALWLLQRHIYRKRRITVVAEKKKVVTGTEAVVA